MGSLYNEWRMNKEKFINSVIFDFGSFPKFITVSRRSFLLMYCYAVAFGNFPSGNWFRLNTRVWYDYQLEDDEVVLFNNVGIIGVTKGIDKQLFNV